MESVLHGTFVVHIHRLGVLALLFSFGVISNRPNNFLVCCISICSASSARKILPGLTIQLSEKRNSHKNYAGLKDIVNTHFLSLKAK